MTGPVDGSHRREFVRAFVAHAWARPGAERPVSRVHITLLVTLGCLAVAVVVGVVLQLLHPIPLAAAPQGPTLPTGVATWSAVTGWDCAPGSGRGFEVGGRTGDWYTVGAGGFAGEGCHGTYETLPMSGDSQRPSPGMAALWWFEPDPRTTRCALALWQPADPPTAVALTRAVRVTVLSGRSGGEQAALTLDQASAPGTWTDLGSYPVSQGGIAVHVDNQGAAVARLALTQVRAACTGVA